MTITQMFRRWLIGWVIVFGLFALLNGASFFAVVFGYSFAALLVAFVSTLGHFSVREFLSKTESPSSK